VNYRTSRIICLIAACCFAASGCSLVPKGQWAAPALVDPDPAANPKAYSSCSIMPCAFELSAEDRQSVVPISVGSMPNMVLQGEVIQTPLVVGEPVETLRSVEDHEFVQESAPTKQYLREAETYYAMATDADKQLDESAMNMFLDAAMASYRYLEQVPPEPEISLSTGRAWEIYHASVARLIHIADRTGHIDKSVGIRLPVNDGFRVVSFEYANFKRTADDFDQWHAVGKYKSKFLKSEHKKPGLGVPFVVVRDRKQCDKWFPPEVPFAATVVLRPESEIPLYDANAEAEIPAGTHVEQIVARLEVYDPKSTNLVEFRCQEIDLAKDTTAPYAYRLSELANQASWASLHGPNCERDGLYIIEPHQKGRIPVIFIHGLNSMPYTWSGIANELEADPQLSQQYEVWVFRYDSSRPIMETAALLRRQLNELVLEMDPSGFDRDLRNAVLVGHSMGGVLAKLLVTDSRDTVWQHVAFQPVSQLSAPLPMKDYLRESFYFNRSPHAGRVVFIGTPHQGLTHTYGTLTNLASRTNSMPCPLEVAHQQLIESNPAAFREEMRRRFPTSGDLVTSSSLLLKGIYRLPIPPEIPSHTILGRSGWNIHDGLSDGVVPVSSARLPGVTTEAMVCDRHVHLHRNTGTVCEVLRILRVHATKPAFAGG